MQARVSLVKGGGRVTLSQLEASGWQGAAPAGLAPGAGCAAHVSAHGWVPVVTPLPRGSAAAASGVGLAASPRGHLPRLLPQQEDRRQLQRRREGGGSRGCGANTRTSSPAPTPTQAPGRPKELPSRVVQTLEPGDRRGCRAAHLAGRASRSRSGSPHVKQIIPKNCDTVLFKET